VALRGKFWRTVYILSALWRSSWRAVSGGIIPCGVRMTCFVLLRRMSRMPSSLGTEFLSSLTLFSGLSLHTAGASSGHDPSPPCSPETEGAT